MYFAHSAFCMLSEKGISMAGIIYRYLKADIIMKEWWHRHDHVELSIIQKNHFTRGQTKLPYCEFKISISRYNTGWIKLNCKSLEIYCLKKYAQTNETKFGVHRFRWFTQKEMQILAAKYIKCFFNNPPHLNSTLSCVCKFYYYLYRQLKLI